MSNILNPDNDSFTKDKNSKIYIDKTGLLEYLNDYISSSMCCFCVSRARRFGKTHAASMIDAYYSRGSSSKALFDNTKIAESKDYLKHLNKYNVIHIDVASIWDYHKDDIVEEISKKIILDAKKSYGEAICYDSDLCSIIFDIYSIDKVPFVIIIDEWDCVIRNSDNINLVHSYLALLHSLFKSEESKSYLALAYLTGILPIKKIEDESAMNNFREFTMISSKPITQYYGFTEDEVIALCEKYEMDFETTKSWYNGYLIDGKNMYNPSSVSQAMLNHEYASYWKNTSAFSTINKFVTLNFEGLKDDVMKMMAGGKCHVNTDTFKNDLVSINSKNEVLTALIHMGYLGYDSEWSRAFIPNYEVNNAFNLALSTGSWTNIANTITQCEELLFATIEKNAEKVAKIVEMAHETYTSVLEYNDENSLSCVLTMAYYTAPAYYTIIRELPSGKGYADFAFIPHSTVSNMPPIIVELKYNKSADTAISQIKKKRYAGVLANYTDNILLVGISYDASGKNNKHHTCVIEEININENIISDKNEVLNDSVVEIEIIPKETLSEQFKRLRTYYGITQKELAQKTGIHQAEISKFERGIGNPSLQTLQRIAEGINKKIEITFKD